MTFRRSNQLVDVFARLIGFHDHPSPSVRLGSRYFATVTPRSIPTVNQSVASCIGPDRHSVKSHVSATSCFGWRHGNKFKLQLNVCARGNQVNMRKHSIPSGDCRGRLVLIFFTADLVSASWQQGVSMVRWLCMRETVLIVTEQAIALPLLKRPSRSHHWHKAQGISSRLCQDFVASLMGAVIWNNPCF